MRTARRLGVQTVAVYSDADQNALHVSMADEAYNIGPPAASESYLRADKILDIAKRTNSQAVHPGYGFLSENVEFSEACQKNNIIFIGPPASAIRDMGIKSTSKAIMSAAGVPIIEGYHSENQDYAKLKEEAAKIGYPIMIKAVRGGGGKGMRIALTESEFKEQLDSARREALKSFGDDVVLLEKFVSEPRHVEVQVFGDQHGNAVHLFERDCSVQRRHQKIIEEAPAPGLTSELRSELGAAAVRAAKAVGYVGAGTVEFILDRHSHSFHFMEMNTRLQVEHPITEMITGTDLVEWQLKIAAGEPIPLTQEQITMNGHAFEARIYAEDPRGGFLPGAGPLKHLTTPKAEEFVRIETGVNEGDEVSVHYDPMIAKLVVWGKDRGEALSKLQAKLTQYNIAGLETNVNFLLDLARHPEFVAANVHTNFIRDYNDTLFRADAVTSTQLTQAALAVILTEEMEAISKAINKRDHYNPFIVESGFRPNYNYVRSMKMKRKDEDIEVKIKYLENNTYEVSTDGGNTWTNVYGELMVEEDITTLKCNIDGAISNVNVYKNEEVISIFDQSGKCEFTFHQPAFLTSQDDESLGSLANRAVSPMPGVLDKLLVAAKDAVKKGDPLFVIIAMKMEHVVKANRDAVVSAVLHKVGDNVPKDGTIVQFEEMVADQ